MLRRVLLAFLSAASISGLLSILPVFALSMHLRSGFGTAVDFLLRILLVPFLVSLALVISCDARESVGWVPFASGPILALLVEASLMRVTLSEWNLLFCLLSACCSIIGAKLAASRVKMGSS